MYDKQYFLNSAVDVTEHFFEAPKTFQVFVEFMLS